MRKLCGALVLALALALGLALPGSGAAESRPYLVIVHKSNPVARLSKTVVARMFMKQVEKWEHGPAVEPVDQAPSAAVRERFSQEVHGRSVSAIQSAWQRAIFSGRGVPPTEKASDREVVSFVADHPGAIGYVEEGAPTEGVKVIEVAR